MSDHLTETKPARRWRKRWIVLAVLLAAFAIFWGIGWKSSNSHLESIRKSGQPVTLAELQAWVPVALGGSNAAVHLNNAMRSFVEAPPSAIHLPIVVAQKNAAELPPPSEPLSEEMKSAISEFLADNEEALRLVHEAAALPQAYFQLNYPGGFEMLLPHLSGFKKLVNLLRIEAIHATAVDDTHRALNAVLTAFKTGSALKDEPILISQLVRVACDSLAIVALERLLSERTLSDAQLLSLLAALRKAEEEVHNGGVRGLVGERCFGINIFTASPQRIAFAVETAGGGGAVSGPQIGGAAAMMLYKISGLQQRDFKFYLRMMEGMIETAALPHPGQMERVERQNQSFRKELAENRFVFLSRMLLPALENATSKFAFLTAQLRCAQLAIGIERYRLANGGRLPETVEHLAPQYISNIPTDPFGGQALVFEPLNKGYRIFGEAHDAARIVKGSVKKSNPPKTDFVVSR